MEKAKSRYAVNKMNNSLDVIKKIANYIGHPSNVVNKARLFNSNMAIHLIFGAKVITMLIDFKQKMEEILDNMRSLFEGLEAIQPTSLEMVLNISKNTKEIPSFYV